MDSVCLAQALAMHLVLKIKRKLDELLRRFIARLEAGGNSQIYGKIHKGTYV